MNQSAVATLFCRPLSCAGFYGPGFKLELPKLQKKGKKKKKRWLELERRHFRILVNVQLSSSLPVNCGLNSQNIRSSESSQISWVGPLPGNIAEVEAYCRIFRAAERFHNVLMDTLCNPLTGECSDSYDISAEDKPLKHKIVSVLGCMVCLLDKGRSSILTNSCGDLNKTIMEDKISPLANFRSEMKSHCEWLHLALENYLIQADKRNLNVWRKLQRLKNVCYDSGFPRGDDQPCQDMFANWAPVYISSSNDEAKLGNLEVAFWMGGQVTEESLRWLLEKGFKTIIDLRAEIVKDNFYENMLNEAVASGKIEVTNVPLEVGALPSMAQVAQFTDLVSNMSKKPIYVHSKEGRRRTLSMISRWRHYIDRVSLHKMRAQCIQESDDSVSFEEDKSFNNGNWPVPLESDSSLDNVDPSSTQNRSVSFERFNDSATNENTVGSGFNGRIEPTVHFSLDVMPLDSQLPPSDVFSRKEMSQFFMNKKVSPEIYFSYEKKRLDMLSALYYNYNGSAFKKEDKCNIILDNKRIMNKSHENVKPSFSRQTQAITNGSYQPPTIHYNSTTHLDKAKNGTGYQKSEENGFVSTRNSVDENVESYISSDDENIDLLEGNMRTSATGVVRLQSRKKVEMFLVRTDGFSCTREKVTESSLAFTHPSTQQQMLLWKSTPKTVLLLKKLGQELIEEAKEVVSFLYYQEKMNVLLEPEVHDVFARIPGFGFIQTFYTDDLSDLHQRVDLVACLGGDGVILHASNLFRGAVPPVVSFNLGSLGFLTSHTFDDYKNDLRHVIHGNKTTDGVYITLRMRLHCQLFRNGKAMPGKIFDVLNEVVVDRGSNPYLSKIECYEHDRLITKVQGDGVIVATPTGSTAYSTAAGGSMVHPNVPCMLFTPICPHSLSFRPVILPDSARLELKIPDDARSTAWVSFDGKRRQQLSRGDSVRISMSRHPLPTVNKSDQTDDWFRSLIRCLNWNERLEQKAL